MVSSQCFTCGAEGREQHTPTCPRLVVLRDQTTRAAVLDGLGKDAPIETNPNGGRQSTTPYFFRGLPPLALAAIAAVLKEGAEKYDHDTPGGPFADPQTRNWHKIADWEHVEHALAHIFADLAGDTQDDHLTHAALRLLMALHQRIRAEQAAS